MIERLGKFRPERDSNPALCNVGAVFNQLSYQANWELVIMWVYAEPVDSVVAQLVEYQTTMQEAMGSNPQWTDTQGLKITEDKVLPL